jgi:uncharacterized phage infection (PIP) family protein YhgE
MKNSTKQRFKNLILREARKLVLEAEITDKEIRSRIEEFYNLQMKIQALETELKENKDKFGEAKKLMQPLLDGMKDTKDKLATTEKYVIEVKKFSFDRQVTSYKDAFELALTKVNEATKKVLKEAVEATKKVSQISHSFSIKKKGELEEANAGTKLLDGLKKAVKSFVSIFRKEGKGIDKANNELQKAVTDMKSK